MARNFPDFINAYMEFTSNGHSPDHFRKWAGIMAVSAALERKVYFGTRSHTFYPNLYLMFLSPPSAGKSSAMRPAVGLLKLMRDKIPTFRFLPNQMSTELLLQHMAEMNSFIPLDNPGKPVMQSAGLFVASEGASCLVNVSGLELVPSLVALYDGDDYKRATLGSDRAGKDGTIRMPALSIVMGITFESLKKIVNEQSIDGGFASRITYVITDQIPDRIYNEEEPSQETDDRGIIQTHPMSQFLISDLVQIGSLRGRMTCAPGVWQRWQAWQTRTHRELKELKSAAMQNLLGRKQDHFAKVLMSVCASRSSELIVRNEDFERTEQLIDEVFANIEIVRTHSEMHNIQSQKGLQQLLMRTIGKHIGDTCDMRRVRGVMIRFGHKSADFESTFKQLIDAEIIKVEQASGSGPMKVRLLDDPNNYL